ncbi:MAG: cell division protein FtsA [Bacteroidia bacterium]|nr:cell division protein FtsA [Bacteroidia bacterium]
MEKNTNPVVVALDIGTTKICAIAGRMTEHQKLDILAVGKVESLGVMRGVVTNIEKTVNAISDAIGQVQKKLDVDIKEIHVGIAGQHIKSLSHRGMLTRQDEDTEISQADIDQLINDMHKLVLPPGDKILHVIPQDYTVDDERGIVDPIGMCGVRLEANFHIITGQISASNNIRKCVEKAGYKIKSITLEPVASAAAVLSEEEKMAGVALVDIGGGTTDLTIFQEGIIRHTAVIPFGGDVITKDIIEGCTIMKKQAEDLKRLHGAALAAEVYNNKLIAIPGLQGREPKEISEINLARIIQARVEEIFDYVYWEIKKSDLEKKLHGGIVLTGGGSLLKNIDLLSELHTGLHTRVGYPVDQLAHGYSEKVNSPIYSTAIGLLIKGLESAVFEDSDDDDIDDFDKDFGQKEPRKSEDIDANKGMFHRTFEKIKIWFEAEPETELK